jgi:ketosteroid isomerase-like protein
MSQESVALVNTALEALRESYENGAATGALLDLCSPGVIVDATRRVFNPALYEGRDGLRRAVQEICEAWEGFYERTDRILEVGDRVVVLQTIGGRGRVSDVHVEQKGALVWTVRGGVIERVDVFGDRAQAMRELGIAQVGEAAATSVPDAGNEAAGDSA